MKKFEYKTIKISAESNFWGTKFDFNIDDIDSILNDYGREGWEMVSAQDIEYAGSTWYFHYTFKREL